jgi:hypothetical protein
MITRFAIKISLATKAMLLAVAMCVSTLAALSVAGLPTLKQNIRDNIDVHYAWHGSFSPNAWTFLTLLPKLHSTRL